MNSCLNCGIQTINPKYCSKKCAASLNNKRPKRPLKQWHCVECGADLIRSSWKDRPIYCQSCQDKRRSTTRNPRRLIALGTAPLTPDQLAQKRLSASRNRLEKEWYTRTLGEMRALNLYPYVRELSRKYYQKSGKPMNCKVCGYNTHVDVCHIKAVKDYPDSALLSEVNSLTNLVALCKNHHWELDNGHLDPGKVC